MDSGHIEAKLSMASAAGNTKKCGNARLTLTITGFYIERLFRTALELAAEEKDWNFSLREVARKAHKRDLSEAAAAAGHDLSVLALGILPLSSDVQCGAELLYLASGRSPGCGGSYACRSRVYPPPGRAHRRLWPRTRPKAGVINHSSVREALETSTNGSTI